MSRYMSKLLGHLLYVFNIYYAYGVNAEQDQNVILTCPFQGKEWNKLVNGAWKRLTNDDKYENVNTSQLTITNVGVADNGQHTCNGPNEGQDFSIYLNVIVVTTNSTVLTCPFTRTDYVWHRYTQNNWITLFANDSKYGNVNTRQLTIFHVDKIDHGLYNCTRDIVKGVIFLYVIVNAEQDQNVILTCPFQGKEWNKLVNGAWKRLTNDDKYENVNTSQLTITNVGVADNGQHTCNGPNEGQDFSIYLNVIVVTTNSTVLTCPFTRTDYVWHRYTQNNWITVFANDSKYGNVNTRQLTIFHVDKIDHGLYNCTRDIVKGVIFLYVIVMPLNVNILNHTYLAVIGGNVTLNCIITGYPVASDIWWTDSHGTRLIGTRYSGGNLSNPSLTIKNVIEFDTGQYTCNATNTAGTTSQSTELETGYTPYAEVARKKYVLKSGENVSIECKVMYADVVLWYKEGIVLSEGTKYKFSAIQKKDLVIYDIRPTDRGGYKCRVTNKFGDYSDDALLKVVDTVNPVSSYEKTANESVILKCLIYDATDVKWWRNNEYIPTETDRYSGGNITEPSLTITKLTRDDTGTYQCESLLESVSAVSSDIELKIRDKPLVKLSEENVIAIVGKDTIIQCSFDSYPKPTGVSWMKDGNILNVEDRAKYNGSTVQIPSLTIYNVNYTDSGTYVCYVENLIGRSSGKSVKVVAQVAEPLKSDSIVGPVAGGVFGGIVAVVVVLAVCIYGKRKWTNSAQSNNYETQNSAKVELHLYNETQRPSNSANKKPFVYVNTSKELISSQIDMNATFTMYDAQDFMLILQDKSSLSKHIRMEYEVVNSRHVFTAANDYEAVDVTTGATIAEEYISKALIKKLDDRNGYIITTVPGQSDIDNFWNMIINYHLTCIVLMMQEVEKIFEFFPNTIEPINTNTFKVEICSVDKLPNKIFVFVLDISNKVTNTVVQVKLYRTTDWKAGETHPSIDTMCKLLDVISSIEPGMVAFMGSQVIGFPVCGNLGACHEVLHAIHNEKDFNILQIVVGLKHIQPDLFQTFEEYNLCYKVIDHFLQNEHTYAVID